MTNDMKMKRLNNIFATFQGWHQSKWPIAVCWAFIICHLSFSTAQAQVGTWNAYMSYYEPQQIVKAGHLLFVRASNSLYSYNLNDHSITTYDKVNALSDTHISLIAWNSTASRLIIVYNNSNIDLIGQNGNVTNLSALYTKSMTQDKTVNSIYISGPYAYLATGFGVVKVNMQRAEIAESYILDQNVTAIATDAATIYVKTKEGNILTAPLAKNLIDPHSWSPGTAPADAFTTDNTDWNEYIETVRTLQPGGPKVNHFGFMTFQNNRLYTSTSGTYNGAIQVMADGNWQFYQDTDLTAISGLQNYSNVSSLAVDPANPDHVFAAARNGLYEFLNGRLVAQYNHANSPIGMYLNELKEYQIITSVAFDNEGNVWLLESQDTDVALLKFSPATGQWTAAQLPELMRLTISGMTHSLGYMKNLHFDSQGYLWFINDHSDLDSFYCIDPKTMTIVNMFETFVNQDGTTYNDYRPHCLDEDREGNIWIGTKVGPFMLDRSNLYTRDTYLTQVKVPRNDGTNFADYLLSGVNISCMAIDGGGRKWFGTSGLGVYLISTDNTVQLANFTSANSPLLSDYIESITIDPQTGEVFFGTDQGLCSYMSDATEAAVEMDDDNIYAYPNPVMSDYNGLITVVGLSFNADVKILTTSGQLVAQGRSNGGTFTWDGRDTRGRRVATGVYMVATATGDGKKGVVCKIAVIN